MEELFNNVLPYAGIGAGGVLPFLVWRVTQLEDRVLALEKEKEIQEKRLNIYYLYFSKKDTNFAYFIEKHEKNI